MVGELVVLTDSETTGYENGTYGIITKFENYGPLYTIYWIMMPDGAEVPMWDTEFEVVSGSRRHYNSS